MHATTAYLETHSQDPFFNLAFEEYVLRNRTEGDYLILWQNDRTIVVGQNQNTEAEINRSFVEQHGLRVVRRMTGGGAVYHDLGNLNYSFITDAGDAEKLSIETFTRPVVKALADLGLQAEASGRNDILVNGKKVSGTAQRLAGGRILHHGTLLFDSDREMVSGALRVDPSKFQSKSAKSVRSRVVNIRSALQEDMDLPAFWDYLKTALAGSGFCQTQLSAEELEAVETLCREKYATWEWNFGRSPKFDLTNKARFPGGGLEVGLHVENGRITDIAFFGDFLAVSPLDDLKEALRGCVFRRAEVQALLEGFPMRELFGGITEAEVLDTIFYAGDA